jgi:hypothetical protein
MSVYASSARAPRLLLAVVPWLVLSCRPATQIILEIDTDIACSDHPTTGIAVGKLSELENRPMSAETPQCNAATGRIGSLVILPGDEKDKETAIRVVTGVTMSVDDCVTSGYVGGCVVARRALSFVPGETLHLPVHMQVSCIDVPCGATETCRDGSCVPATIADPNDCISKDGCDVASPDTGGTGGTATAGEGGAGGVTTNGGESTMGGTPTSGGMPTSGASSTGGTPETGGTTTGGMSTGGMSTGGMSTGGMSTGGTTTGGMSTGGTGGGLSATCPAVTSVAGNTPLIDNLEDGDAAIMPVDSRVGFWLTKNDSTPTAQQNPPIGAFAPTTLSAHGGNYSARTWGSGFASWALLRAQLQISEAGECQYDASRYTGISFWARSGSNFGTPIGVSVATSATVATDKGGSCQLDCFDYHFFTIVPTTSWMHYQAPWTALKQKGWGTPAGFNSTKIMYVEFAFTDTAFDFYVDDLSFY